MNDRTSRVTKNDMHVQSTVKVMPPSKVNKQVWARDAAGGPGVSGVDGL